MPKAETIARELGLEFQSETTKDGKWLRLKFAFPADVTSPEYNETVKKVTAWRTKVSPWMFEDAPDVVAVELSFWNRFTVAKFNKKNRKARRAYTSDDAVARRLAMTQPTPMQGLAVLRERVPNSKDPETVKLRALLARAAEIVAREPVAAQTAPIPTDNVVPLRKWA